MIEKQVSKKRIQNSQFRKIIGSYLGHTKGERGFTIIESLMAIVVVSILLAAIAPVLSLSVATRVQSRRIELATQAARAYIDGVRSKTITEPTSIATTSISAFPAPTTTGELTCSANSYCSAPSGTSLYCVDFDGNGRCDMGSVTDMIVQAFRYNRNATATASNGYSLGIRVYRADAFRTSTTLFTNSNNPRTSNANSGQNTKATQGGVVGGMGERRAPLVEMTADINDTVPSYSELCARLKGASPNQTQANNLDNGCSNN
ncbi:MAG: hormogonium polysaccharide secretion pseudopilin HpsB [Scytonematopsis contorta HA4267-MV1]|jgi:prepilin-type N-terminal cleavage/methylation domain-containing protein|nr:hormogonium polysaccharide secretion pseudopilin HpsB [Scytonematopsis contorta HA4267-MV1]